MSAGFDFAFHCRGLGFQGFPTCPSSVSVTNTSRARSKSVHPSWEVCATPDTELFLFCAFAFVRNLVVLGFRV